MSVKEMDLLSPTHGSGSLREDYTWKAPGIKESTSVGLRTCEASIQKQCEGCADTVWSRY